jgi:hypothetical protein
MKKLPSNISEKIYDVLIKFAEASPNHYDKEEFIYHYSVSPNTTNEFVIKCIDGKPRTFVYHDRKNMTLFGKGGDRVNEIIKKIIDLQTIKYEEFEINKNEI